MNKLTKTFLILLLIAGLCFYGYYETHYSMTVTVTEFDFDNYTVTTKNNTGKLFSYYVNDFDFDYGIGDTITLKMHTNYTDTSVDDMVIGVSN